MKVFGYKESFAIEYEMQDTENGYFEMWVGAVPVCCFDKENVSQHSKWNVLSIAEWFAQNMPVIMNECEFPLPVTASTALEFYHKSGDYDSDDFEEFCDWFDKRQEWFFSHSWYINRAGSYLADVLFRKVNDAIEIEWDNNALYDEVTFVNPKGLYYTV